MRIKLITNTTMKLYNQYEGSKQTPPGGGTLQHNCTHMGDHSHLPTYDLQNKLEPIYII